MHRWLESAAIGGEQEAWDNCPNPTGGHVALRADNGLAVVEDNIEVLRKFFAATAEGDFATTWAFDPQVEYARIASDDPGTNVAATISRFKASGHDRCRRRCLFVSITEFVDTSPHHAQ